MTFFTNRNYIKPMLRGITFVMMILRRLMTAGALQRACLRQFASYNGNHHSAASFYSFRVILLIAFPANFALFALLIMLTGTLTSLFTFVGFVIIFSRCFAMFCLKILFRVLRFAQFAPISVSIFVAFVLAKFRQWLDLFAFRAAFCFNYLSHNQLLYSWLRLEPALAGHVPAVGSLYYSKSMGDVK